MYRNNKDKEQDIKSEKEKISWLSSLSKSIVSNFSALQETQSLQHSKEQCPASGR